MTGENKLEYGQLEAGYEFPQFDLILDKERVAAYLKAVGETHSFSLLNGQVPPAAIAAWALVSLLEFVSLPAGTIHLSQEIQSFGIASFGDTLTCRATVSRKQERGKVKLLNIDIEVTNQEGSQLLSSKSGFNLP